MTGTSTPTRSCLKRRLQAAKNSLSVHSGSSDGPSCSSDPSTKRSLCKTVSFDGTQHIYFADPDYDRHSVPVTPKLSYEDLLELKMLNVHMMCPQNKCSNVPIGILPLLPPSGSCTPSPTSSTSNSFNPYQPRNKNFSGGSGGGLGRHLSERNQHFVGLLDDDLASMSSMTPPPSSPSDHSPNTSGIPLPKIATDEEGQLIFQFSASDDFEEEIQSIIHERDAVLASATTRHESHKWKHVTQNQKNMGKNGIPPPIVAVASTGKSTGLGKSAASPTASPQQEVETVPPPFPVLPSQSSSSSSPSAAMTLTPSFFSLAPPPPPPTTATANNDGDVSPFPFAPPVPTTAGLPDLPTFPIGPSVPTSPKVNCTDTSTSTNVNATPTQSTVASPFLSSSQHQTHKHHRSISSPTSSPIASPKKASATLSPLATPHASPTFMIPLHAHMRSPPAPRNGTSDSSAPPSHPAAPGPLVSLQQRHPLSPQLS
ncbi:hypothetical protein FRC18_008017, partial [Serendipita sp. 400]